MKNLFLKILKRTHGSAALEFIIIILPCLILMFLFLNILFIVGNLMLTQSNANRIVQQVAAHSCLPQAVENRAIEKNKYLGVENIKIIVYSGIKWQDRNGKIRAVGISNPIQNNQNAKVIAPNCAEKVTPGGYVFVRITYKQSFVLMPGIDSLNLSAQAASISSGFER